MKAKEGVIDYLNKVVKAELTAVHQYLIHSAMCRNWGYDRLHEEIRGRALEEVGHVQEVIHHILYLDGQPDVQRLGTVVAGETVPDQLNADLKMEHDDLALLTEAIAHCSKVGDYSTRHLLEDMAVETDEHIDWIETQQELIKQVGLQGYLSEQIKKG